jgi:hypothetical protein
MWVGIRRALAVAPSVAVEEAAPNSCAHLAAFVRAPHIGEARGAFWEVSLRYHICAGTGLTPGTSAPRLGSPLPHLRWDLAHPCHICAGTGLPATSAPGTLSLCMRRRRPALDGALRRMPRGKPHATWQVAWHVAWCTLHAVSRGMYRHMVACGVQLVAKSAAQEVPPVPPWVTLTVASARTSRGHSLQVATPRSEPEPRRLAKPIGPHGGRSRAVALCGSTRRAPACSGCMSASTRAQSTTRE